MGIGAKGWVALGEVLPELKHLKVFDAHGCRQLRDEGGVALAAGLGHAPSLEILDVRGCDIGQEGAAALAEAIETMPKLLDFVRAGYAAQNLWGNSTGNPRHDLRAWNVQF